SSPPCRHRQLPSFPTRRSSDLSDPSLSEAECGLEALGQRVAVERERLCLASGGTVDGRHAGRRRGGTEQFPELRGVRRDLLLARALDQLGDLGRLVEERAGLLLGRYYAERGAELDQVDLGLG